MLQQYLNHELPYAQAGFRKGIGSRDQIASIYWIIEKAREFQKSICFCFIDYTVAFDPVDQNKLEKSDRLKYQATWPASVHTSWSSSLNLTWGNWLVPDGKEHIRAIYCHSAYLNSVQSTSWKRWAGWSTSWNQDSQEKYQQPQICRWHHPYGRKWRGTKEPLDESEREWKSWLKTQYSKNEDHGIRSHHFMANRWVNNGNSHRFSFLGLQYHCEQWLQPRNWKTLAPWKKSYDKPTQHIKMKRHYF